jgi:hypothetical protein
VGAFMSLAGSSVCPKSDAASNASARMILT